VYFLRKVKNYFYAFLKKFLTVKTERLMAGWYAMAF